MEAAMQTEVAKIVANLAPRSGALGILTSEDVRQIIERAAAQGVLAGWAAGMRQAREILAETLEKSP